MGGDIEKSKIMLCNDDAVVEIDECGAAITGFYLKEDGINPLSFELPLTQMSPTDGMVKSFKGHFLCLGRWGPPSTGELASGAVKHGDFATRRWQTSVGICESALDMSATSSVEGLRVKRRMVLDRQEPVLFVRESVTNINPLGRFYNMVQHPTIAAPFLNDSTRVFCNASRGFCQGERPAKARSYTEWPLGMSDNGNSVDLSMSNHPDNNVYSFVLGKQSKFGWIVAYSPAARLAIGYIWLRSDYPWVNFWQDWSNGKMRYRGLEFGTTGVHEPLHRIIEMGRSTILGEKTIRYLDAGEQVDTCYTSFLLRTERELEYVSDVTVSDKEIYVKTDREVYKIGVADKGNLF